MEWFWGMLGYETVTPEQAVRGYRREIERTSRALKRQREQAGRQEKTLLADMKRAARKEPREVLVVMAKGLVQTRKLQRRLELTTAHMTALSLRLQTMGSTAALARAMQGATSAMRAMNDSVRPEEMQKVLMEFQRQCSISEQASEVMDEALDEAFDDDEEVDDVVQAVVDEVILGLKAELADATPAAPAAAAAEEVNLDGLRDRLRDLRE
eukprot:TRINITY_DN43222_c0_g1_i1.p1 TRINITY_DN43222_c0_g1~~TRINITY_DN43222_c0_g1_i1.p1  ORF type:complete len:211 (+),score=93.67 TRINITY_DN43222_c0_g1_i1:70-702(+)